MNDNLIVKGLKLQNEKAFDEMFYKYKNLVFFVIDSIVSNRETSEELLQDSFLDAYNKIDSFKEGTNFKAWLLRIAKNKAINYYNKDRKEIIDEDLIYSTKQEEDNVEELYHDLRQILSEDEFTVLIMSAVYDVTHKDIGAYLNKPTGTISWLYQEAKKKAKKYLKGA